MKKIGTRLKGIIDIIFILGGMFGTYIFLYNTFKSFDGTLNDNVVYISALLMFISVAILGMLSEKKFNSLNTAAGILKASFTGYLLTNSRLSAELLKPIYPLSSIEKLSVMAGILLVATFLYGFIKKYSKIFKEEKFFTKIFTVALLYMASVVFFSAITDNIVIITAAATPVTVGYMLIISRKKAVDIVYEQTQKAKFNYRGAQYYDANEDEDFFGSASENTKNNHRENFEDYYTRTEFTTESKESEDVKSARNILSRSKTIEELEKNYKLLQKLHHPDAGGDNDTCSAINEMYNEMKANMQA